MESAPIEVKKKLEAVLEHAFPGCEIELESGWTEGRWGGLLVWNGFDRQEMLDRQRRLWRVIREGMTPEEELRVAPIMAMTPREMAVIRDED